ncbi:hypothetical protein MANI_012042 [Metarhizium anisopliae]
MCICTILHYHHAPPCPRPVIFTTHYLYCPDAIVNPVTNEILSPCSNTSYKPSPGIDYPDPCSTGGCLISPLCSTGTCRLEDLNGLWVCCQCDRGGNQFRTCTNRKWACPDTFCYHKICQGCRPDLGKVGNLPGGR